MIATNASYITRFSKLYVGMFSKYNSTKLLNRKILTILNKLAVFLTAFRIIWEMYRRLCASAVKVAIQSISMSVNVANFEYIV